MSFTSSLGQWCSKTKPEDLRRTVKIVLIEMGNRLVLRSPVGDDDFWIHPAPDGYVGGQFRANWQYGYGFIPEDTLDMIDPSGQGTIAKIRDDVTGSEVLGLNYIVNNLPYAQALEDGHSRQSPPQGMKALTELEFPEIVRRAASA